MSLEGLFSKRVQLLLDILALLEQIHLFELQGPDLFLEGVQLISFELCQHLLILNIFLWGQVIQMSKKYFINNLDTPFGQALISELVKEPTEDPPHMGTVRVPVDKKPQGIKKILKREKPKLFRKKAIEECEVYVYSLEQTQLSDIEFGIESMQKPFEDNKVFIFVSDIMAWSSTPRKIKKEAPPPPPQEGEENPPPHPEEKLEAEVPENKSEEEVEEKEVQQQEAQEEEKPIEYTFFQDGDYLDRVPASKYSYIKQIEDKVLLIKRENVKVFIICPGIVYGCGEDTFYQLFKASWLQQPVQLPFLGEGNNQIPTIHLKDLVKFVIKVAQNPPEGSPYLLALDETVNKTQKALIQCISSGIGSGKIIKAKDSELIQNPDRYLVDLDMRSSKVLVGIAEEPVQFQWTARKGMQQSIDSLLKDFCEKEQLRPLKMVMLQKDQDWKDSKISYIHSSFSSYYRIPVLNIRTILQNVKEFADDQLCADLKEEWNSIMVYLSGTVEVTELNQTMKVFIRAVRWRLSQNDCRNRGYILDNFPNFNSELNYIFSKISLKKLKRKKAKPVPPPLPKPSEKSIGSEGDLPLPEEPKQEEEPPKEEEEAIEEEGGEEDAGPKTEPYYPESVITIKKMGKSIGEEVVDFFVSAGMEDLIYDTTGNKDQEIFQSLRNYIERNGKPNNYLITEEQLFSKYKSFTAEENKLSLDKKAQEVKRKTDAESEKQARRQKLAEEIIEVVKNEGEEEIKKMPFRNYLMEFVVPTLNVGLLEVSNIIPNDPVDLLAQFLYQKSYDV